MQFLKNLIFPGGFMPHGNCYLWTPGLIGLHVVSDSLIALSYLSIPITLLHFTRKRRDIPFSWMFLCFGAFIVACGGTHLMEVWTIWFPSYWLAGALKAVTAGFSVATAILLIRVTPRALALPGTAMAHRDQSEAHRGNPATSASGIQLAPCERGPGGARCRTHGGDGGDQSIAPGK